MDRQTNDEYQRSKDDVHEGLPPWFKEMAACEAAKCGISEHEIARELGVSRTTVRKWLDK